MEAMFLNNNGMNDNEMVVSSHQLASKLRKIKENLDNCYLTTTKATTTTASTAENDLIKLQHTNRGISSPSSASSISKLLFLNNENNFDFEINDDKTSLDFILDQFKTNKTQYRAPSNLVSLKQTVYTDNLSRQSSIRSLISCDNNTTIITKPTNVNLINSASSGVLASVGVCTIPPIYNENNLNYNNRFKQIKSKNQVTPVYTKHEIDLLNDWDKYKPVIKMNSNQASPVRVIKNNRPETRLGFLQGDTPDSLNNEPKNNNDFNDCFEFSDNATIMSSPALSSKYYQLDNNSEIYEYAQLTPLNMKSNKVEKTKEVKNEINGRVSAQSVLSNFVSNLKFEELSKHSNPSSSKKSLAEEFNHDFDIVTVSEALTDEPYNKINHNSNKPTTPSLIIREKKTNNKTKLSNNKTESKLCLLNQTNQEYENCDEDDLSDEHLEKSSTSSSSNQRVKNYQRLSHSINDLFSNLLQQLEKQKNKDYSNRSNLNFNSEDYLNFQLSPTDLARIATNSLFKIPNKTTKSQNLSKDSNKDSGFNQEFVYGDDPLNQFQNRNCFDNNSLTYSNDDNKSANNQLKTNDNKLNILCDDLSELSLLDRFLNNEQLVAFKHSKLERILSKKFNINDFSIIEYILNQESISLNTFKNLIREKFKSFKWTDSILNELHIIINQPIESDKYFTDENIYNYYDDDFNSEDKFKDLVITDDVKPQTGSMKSFKKIKLIKSSISYKRKLNQLEQTENTFLNANNDIFKPNLNSFTKRRERKGSLPEINTSHIVDFETNNDIPNRNFSTKTPVIIKNDFSNRNSRKSAFVLEILRTSMFRSKSLSDLNSSLVKIGPNNNQNFNLNQNNISINYLNQMSDCNANNGTDNTLDISLHDSYSVNNYQIENYTGLIWQCADMIYEEYKNKYEELRWLMNGDNLSVTSKLKEVEERLRIEWKIRDKNSQLLYKLNTENTNTKNKYIEQRLESQLKIITEKIKELEMMRLFLKMCEVNNRGLENENLNTFFNIESKVSLDTKNNNLLEGKSYSEVLKTLYRCDSICSGFVYQFYVIYRYMLSSIELLEFFKSNFSRAFSSNFHQKGVILDRTIDLIAMWIDGFYVVDFQQNQELINKLEAFIENEIKSYDDSKYLMIYNLLINPKVEFNLFNTNKKRMEIKAKNKVVKKFEQETKKVNRILNSEIKKKGLFKCKSSEHLLGNEDASNLSNSLYKRSNFFISDYPCELVASQLTLIEWDNFLDIHVCHCLNSRAQGVNCDAKQPIDPNIINIKQCLFVDNYLSKSLYKMIQFNYLLTHWVSAEILMIENLKSQAELITNFLKIAKKCNEWSNFSSAFAIYDGLQEATVRNLRAWQHVSHKTFQILDKIASVKLLFQNEPFLLNHLSKTTSTPVIPSILSFLLIIQKSEHGSFQLANKEWKWSKLSNIANLVDQIRVVQQHFKCCFTPCEEFVENLLLRIYYLKDFDLNNLAENNLQDYIHSQKLNTSSNSSIMNLIPNRKKL